MHDPERQESNAENGVRGDFLRPLLNNGQRHAKRNLRTYAKSVDPDQSPSLRRRVWSGSALFDSRHINGTYFSCCVNSLITYKCFQYRLGRSWSTLCEMSKGLFSRDAGHVLLWIYIWNGRIPQLQESKIQKWKSQTRFLLSLFMHRILFIRSK